MAEIIFEPVEKKIHLCSTELHELETKRYVESADYLVQGTIARCSCNREWRLAKVPSRAKDAINTFMIASDLSWVPHRSS